MSVADRYKTKNATFFTSGLNEITSSLLQGIYGVTSVKEFDSIGDRPRGFQVILPDSSFRIFADGNTDALSETKSGFLGWINAVCEGVPKADAQKLRLDIESVTRMYGVVAEREFTMNDAEFSVIEKIALEIDAILFIYDSVMSANSEFICGKLWEVGQALLPKPWWKFWG